MGDNSNHRTRPRTPHIAVELSARSYPTRSECGRVTGQSVRGETSILITFSSADAKRMGRKSLKSRLSAQRRRSVFRRSRNESDANPTRLRSFGDPSVIARIKRFRSRRLAATRARPTTRQNFLYVRRTRRYYDVRFNRAIRRYPRKSNVNPTDIYR